MADDSGPTFGRSDLNDSKMRSAPPTSTLPALIGKLIGGCILFTALIWAQIRKELPSVEESR